MENRDMDSKASKECGEEPNLHTYSQGKKSSSKRESLSPQELYEEGMNRLKNKDFKRAVKLLDKACTGYVRVLGELHEEMYPFYYHYADALISLFETSKGSELFGAAVPGQIAVENQEAEQTVIQQNEEEGKEEEDDEEGMEEVEGEVEEVEEGMEEEENEGEGEEEKEDEGEGEEEEKEEEKEDTGCNIDDLEVAWENLEVSRVILTTKVQNPDFLIKVHTRLGDLLTWKEDFESANEEYQNAHNLLIASSGSQPSRQRAELYFLQGQNCLNCLGKEDQAAAYFNDAILQLAQVKSLVSEEEGKELDEIIQEIVMKKDDAMEQKDSFKQINEEPKQEQGFSEPTVDQVTDLGVLGKRQRERYEEKEKENAEEQTNLPEYNDTKKPKRSNDSV